MDSESTTCQLESQRHVALLSEMDEGLRIPRRHLTKLSVYTFCFPITHGSSVDDIEELLHADVRHAILSALPLSPKRLCISLSKYSYKVIGRDMLELKEADPKRQYRL
jgi:hypothetical protein